MRRKVKDAVETAEMRSWFQVVVWTRRCFFLSFVGWPEYLGVVSCDSMDYARKGAWVLLVDIMVNVSCEEARAVRVLFLWGLENEGGFLGQPISPLHEVSCPLVAKPGLLSFFLFLLSSFLLSFRLS